MDIVTLSTLLFWITFVLMLVASIQSGLLMLFRRKLKSIVIIMSFYTVGVILMAKDATILENLRMEYFHLDFYYQIGIILLLEAMLIWQFYQWKRK